MPNTLGKTRKAIAKKRNGTIEALHVFSRDSKRLHKAQVRDERLEKLASARKKQDRPLSPLPLSDFLPTFEHTNASIVDRVSFFQDAVKENEGRPFEMAALQTCVHK